MSDLTTYLRARVAALEAEAAEPTTWDTQRTCLRMMAAEIAEALDFLEEDGAIPQAEVDALVRWGRIAEAAKQWAYLPLPEVEVHYERNPPAEMCPICGVDVLGLSLCRDPRCPNPELRKEVKT